MAYVKKIWKDYPDTTTPITTEGLNNIENGLAGVLDWIYPVGTIYETTSTDLDTTTKMANHFGGTWEVYGEGRVLVAKSAETEFNTIGKIGGHKLLQAHTHNVETGVSEAGNTEIYPAFALNARVGYHTTAKALSTGGGDSQNLQPYIVVYRYRRTA